MWKKTYSKYFKGVSKESIWNRWIDVNKWTTWHLDLDYCTLKGAFAVGNHFMLKPKGVKEVKILIIDLKEGTEFTDCTHFFGAKMYDTHRVEEKEGGVVITNHLSVTGPLKWLWIFLVAKNVACTVPNEVNELINLVKSEK